MQNKAFIFFIILRKICLDGEDCGCTMSCAFSLVKSLLKSKATILRHYKMNTYQRSSVTQYPQVGPHVRGSTHSTWLRSQSDWSSLNKHFLGPYSEPDTLLSTRDQAVSKQAKSIPSWSLHSTGRCQLQIGACYLPLQGLSCATAAADLQHPLKGVLERDQE